jgi:hypothetical protein
MATKYLTILERDERLQLLCLNQRGIPIIGLRLRSQSRKMRGGAALACRQQCLRPGKQSGLTKSERCALTLTVHHRNRIPEDNRLENLVALCTACHLSYHNRGQSNVSPGQLSLFPDDGIDWELIASFEE